MSMPQGILKCSLIFIVIIALGLLTTGSGNAYPVEPDHTEWKTVSTMESNFIVSGPHFVQVSSTDTIFYVRAPQWQTVSVVQTDFLTYEEAEPTWEIVSVMESEFSTQTDWQTVADFYTTMSTATTWQECHVVSVIMDTNTTWLEASIMVQEIIVTEEYIPPEPDVPTATDSATGWLTVVTYLLILWLPSMIVGHIFPGKVQVLLVVMTGIALYITYSSFLIVMVGILIGCFIIIIHKGDD